MVQHSLRLLDDLRAVETYVAVVEAGGITAAARRLRLMPSTVSKRISDLEARAALRLLHRTTRRISVTDIGRRFYDQCVHLLEGAEQAEAELQDDAGDIGGRIRVAAPVIFAQRQMAPLLPSFLMSHPRIHLELVASARTVNLVGEGFDLSIRLMSRDDVGANGRVLTPNRRVCCASPAYLARFGEPNRPHDLVHHACLMALSLGRGTTWQFKGKRGVESVRVSGPLAADSAQTLAEAARQGLGVAMLGTFVVGDDLRAGSLREILRRDMLQRSVFAAIFPDRGAVPRRVMLLIDHLAAAFGPTPPWDHDLP